MATMTGCKACHRSIAIEANICPYCNTEQRAWSSAPATRIADETELMQGMTDQQRLLFSTQLLGRRKNATTGVLFSLFLGGLGAHHFYMGSIGLGALYVLFCWTFIPAFLGLVEAFFMSGRVRDYNLRQAAEVAVQVQSLSKTTA